MPIYYNRGGSTYIIYYYSSTSDLTGTDVDATHRLAIRVGGATKYIGLSSNLSHPQASHLRMNIAGTAYAILLRSKQVVTTLTTNGATYTVTSDMTSGLLSMRYRGCGAGHGGRTAPTTAGGGGGGGAAAVVTELLLKATGAGAAGSGGQESIDASTTTISAWSDSGLTFTVGDVFTNTVAAAVSGTDGVAGSAGAPGTPRQVAAANATSTGSAGGSEPLLTAGGSSSISRTTGSAWTASKAGDALPSQTRAAATVRSATNDAGRVASATGGAGGLGYGTGATVGAGHSYKQNNAGGTLLPSVVNGSNGTKGGLANDTYNGPVSCGYGTESGSSNTAAAGSAGQMQAEFSYWASGS